MSDSHLLFVQQLVTNLTLGAQFDVVIPPQSKVSTLFCDLTTTDTDSYSGSFTFGDASDLLTGEVVLGYGYGLDVGGSPSSFVATGSDSVLTDSYYGIGDRGVRAEAWYRCYQDLVPGFLSTCQCTSGAQAAIICQLELCFIP